MRNSFFLCPVLHRPHDRKPAQLGPSNREQIFVYSRCREKLGRGTAFGSGLIGSRQRGRRPIPSRRFESALQRSPLSPGWTIESVRFGRSLEVTLVVGSMPARRAGSDADPRPRLVAPKFRLPRQRRHQRNAVRSGGRAQHGVCSVVPCGGRSSCSRIHPVVVESGAGVSSLCRNRSRCCRRFCVVRDRVESRQPGHSRECLPVRARRPTKNASAGVSRCRKRTTSPWET